MRVPIGFRIGDRSFSISDGETQAVGIEGICGSAMVDGQMVSLHDAASSRHEINGMVGGRKSYRLTHTFDDQNIIWRWDILRGDSTLEVTATIRNTGERSITLGKWHPVEVEAGPGGRISIGSSPANNRFFRWQMWDMRVQLLSSEGGKHESQNVCHIYDPGSGLTLFCGFTTIDRMLCSHSVEYSEDSGIISYRASCDFGDYRLQPGQEISSERLLIAIYDDPHEALEGWAELIHELYQPVFPSSPPLGWCGGGWIDSFSEREECWEKVAIQNARAIREKLQGFGVKYIWTSQYNLKDGLPGNWLTVEEEQIPSGLEGFFQAIMEMGFTPGLWVAPFWFYSEAEGVLDCNRENLLRDVEGRPVTEPAGWEFYRYSREGGEPMLTKYHLDGTHPKTEAFIRKVFSYYKRIGVRYYMLDFLKIWSSAKLHDPSRTPLESARRILRVLRESAGEDTHLQSAVSSTPGYIGIINAARVGRDFGEGRPFFPPFSTWNNATYPLHDLHFGSLHHFLQNAATSYFTHRKVYLNDLNLLTIDKPIPENHARIAVTIFGMCGSPMMLGDDYRRIDPGRLRMVKMCLPRTEKMTTPVDLFDNPHPDGYCHMLKLPVESEWDSYLILAVFSTDPEPYLESIEFERLGLDPRVPYRVFEFWNQEYIGTFKGHFPCRAPPSDCRLYRISRARDHPWLLSTDFHVQQGAVEIGGLVWNEAEMKLTGTVKRPAGEGGNLFFLMPREFRLINHEGAFLVKEILDMNVVIRKPIYTTGDQDTFELRFERLGTKYVSRPGWLPFSTEKEWLDYLGQKGRDGDPRVID